MTGVAIFIKRAAHRFHVTPDDVRGRSHAARFVRPRHVAMFLAWSELKLGFAEIGLLFGRDETSVREAVLKMEFMMVRDVDLAGDVAMIKGGHVMPKAKSTLSQEQIDEAYRLRYVEAMPWHKIAKALGCDNASVQREINPNYDADRRWRKQKVELQGIRDKVASDIAKPTRVRQRAEDEDFEGGSEERHARRKTVKSDDAFVHAMTVAVRTKRERAPIGIDTRPCTDDPKFVSTCSADVRSIYGSTAQMCADIA